MRNKLYELWKSEEEHAFLGWDFSHLDGRWADESLPWEYMDIVLSYLKRDDYLLDMGTGGGEFLLSLNHSNDRTAVTEGYEPNYKLCKKKLAPLGIDVQWVDNRDSRLNFFDDAFDIVINRHESFDNKEVRRVLKPDGTFITQQVGDRNNYSLSSGLIDGYTAQCGEWNKAAVAGELEGQGFEILYSDEAHPYLRFFDVGAICYYAKIIEWEFPDFSVHKCYDKLMEYHKVIEDNGYVQTLEHRFVFVCRNVK